MFVSKKIPEHEREKTSVGLDRRVGGPPKQDRPPSPAKFEADMKDFEELVEFAKKTIEDIAERYKNKATGDAKIIKTEDIVMDMRVRWKCIIPTCFGYGSSPHCPPNSPTYEEMKEIVSQYKYAIMVKYSPRVRTMVMPRYGTEGIQVANEVGELVSMVEAEAGYMGYYLAMGFKGGPCGFCGILNPEYIADFMLGKDIPRCAVLEGKMCNHYLQARPALEACSVDVFATAKKVGWETPYIIMPEHPKKSVPFVSWHGIVLLV